MKTLIALLLAGILYAAGVLAQDACGPIANAYGPYDYWVNKAELPIVEVNHLTPEVENLIRGKSSSIGGDLEYTLRAFPNHPRALLAMVKLGVKEKTDKPRGSRYTVACFFDRAIRFRPNDGMVRMIHANYLSGQGRKQEAVKELEVAAESGVMTPNLQYNMGLAYFEVGNFEKSLEFAHQAYRNGFNLPGLKGKLVKAGKWRDAPAAQEPAAAVGAGGAPPAADGGAKVEGAK